VGGILPILQNHNLKWDPVFAGVGVSLGVLAVISVVKEMGWFDSSV
jgi:hypothetical protein